MYVGLVSYGFGATEKDPCLAPVQDMGPDMGYLGYVLCLKHDSK